MSEDLKKLVELPENLRELLSELPDDVADECLKDTDKYALAVESMTEMLEGLGFDSYELKPQLIDGLVQYYQPKP